MKKIHLSLVVAATIFAAGCETTSSRPYTASTKNIIAFQKSIPTGKKVEIGDFTAAAEVNTNPTCRALGALEVAPGKTPIEFIQEAFREEIFEAGAYDSAGTVLQGKLTALTPDSVGEGTWTIGLNLSSVNNPAGFDVSTVYAFKSSYSAIRACQNVVDAFTPAVQDVIAKSIASPEFSKLF